MEEDHEFYIPDYFLKFSCKMGACRSACCERWQISLSMKNYFSLLGVQCSRELRRHLDCAMRITDHPNEECYAAFEAGYDGNCKMRRDDGLCSIQKELGEAALPDICRLYPRGIRKCGGRLECSCANSCEAVPELFLGRREPISFVKCRLPLPIPEDLLCDDRVGVPAAENDIRMFFISFMQDKKMPLIERLRKICVLAKALDSGENIIESSVREKIMSDYTAEHCGVPAIDAVMKKNGTLPLMAKLVDIMNRNGSLRNYGSEAAAYFAESDNAAEAYDSADKKLREKFPDFDSYIEHLLVNHMFFTLFPFTSREITAFEEAEALCAVYEVLDFLLVGAAGKGIDDEKLTDITAASFRVIEHTHFDIKAAKFMKESGTFDIFIS